MSILTKPPPSGDGDGDDDDDDDDVDDDDDDDDSPTKSCNLKNFSAFFVFPPSLPLPTQVRTSSSVAIWSERRKLDRSVR